MAFKIICALATLAVANAGFIDAPGHLAYTGDARSYHNDLHDYAPVAKVSYSSAPSVSHVYNTVKEVSHTPVHYAAPIEEHDQYAPVQKTVEYAPVQKTVEYTPVHKTVQYDHHSTPSHTLAYPIKKAVAYAPIAKTISYAPSAVFESHAHTEPIYQHTHESVERTHDGTVSHYGKTISSPHSHVQKYDTRVTNEHYKLAAVPAVHYKVAPVVQDIHHYTHSKPVVPVVQDVHHYTQSTPVHTEYTQSAPVQHQYSHSTPVQHQYSHSTPVQHQYSHSAPVQHQYIHSAPVQQQYSQPAPVQHYYSQNAATHQYAHAAPVVAHKAVSYSPAEAVSHTTFHSNDAQYSW